MEKRDRLHSTVMGWLVFTTLVMPPVVLTRCLIQPDYKWSSAGHSGVGLGGDLWFVIVTSLFVAAMMWYGWRGARMPFHVLAVLWSGALSAMLIGGIIEHSEQMRLRGDSLGIDIWLGWLIPVYVVFTALTAVWAVRDVRSTRLRASPAWSRRNVLGVWIAAMLWLVAAVLFRIGELHDATDVAAVLCMFVFWIVLNVWGLRPDTRSTSFSRVGGVQATPRIGESR